MCPDPDTILDYYLANGTWIDSNDLARQFADINHNADLDTDLEFWQAHDARLSIDTNAPYTGTGCMRISERSDEFSGATQDVTQLLITFKTYNEELTYNLHQSSSDYFSEI